jgi:hypothetical protein
VGLLLHDCRSRRYTRAQTDVANRSLVRSQARSLLSIARLEIARSRVFAPSCRRIRIARITLSFRGGFCPVSLPLFHGTLGSWLLAVRAGADGRYPTQSGQSGCRNRRGRVRSKEHSFTATCRVYQMSIEISHVHHTPEMLCLEPDNGH